MGGNYHGQNTLNELHPVRLSAYSHSARNTLGENPLLATELQIPRNGSDEGVTKLLFDDSPAAHGHGKILGANPVTPPDGLITQSGHTP